MEITVVHNDSFFYFFYGSAGLSLWLLTFMNSSEDVELGPDSPLDCV